PFLLATPQNIPVSAGIFIRARRALPCFPQSKECRRLMNPQSKGGFMSDIANPKTHPELAAAQLVIELVRAERVPIHHDNVNGLLKIYDQALQHFKTDHFEDGSDR
ncbi:hypothetical protein ACLH02_24635, partial [Enterobacter hormaechei]|uniref:hypothetical protein n=5 Tax=Enterobacterales TaxID=91347 RepID=UPI0039839299